MRVLVHGGSLSGDSGRMRLAALGLALRGHAVAWRARHGAAPAVASDTLHPVESWRSREARADLVLGGPAPRAVAFAGWLAGAHSMVLDVSAGRESWGFLDRACFDSFDGWGLEEAVADAAPAEGARVLAWSSEPPPGEPDVAHPDVDVLERLCEQVIARQRGLALRPAVFLDRDGTLVIERGYLSDPADIELLPAVPGALRSLRAAGYRLVVVSNQSGVGRGLFPRSRVHQAMARLRVELRRHGIEIDAIDFCPHRPEAGCACRKPGTEMIERASANLGLSPRHSAMIGDKRLDVETGHRAGALGVLVRTGYGRDEEAAPPSPDFPKPPDFVANDLGEAATWLLSRPGGPLH